MKRDCLLAATAVMLCSLAAFAAEGLDQRIARVLALKGGEVSSLTATLHTKADPEGKDPLAIWRAEAKEKVELKDAFVRVDFTIVPEKGCDIKCRAEMPLPEKWDGRMWGQGNSGRAGSLPSLKGYIASGTAAVTTDLGTSAFARKDKLVPWPACVLRDFHWRATHLMTVYGKRIVEAFYGRSPSKSYFAGGSTGGRQAMSEAIRFPEDYDGMYVVLPDNNAAASEIAIWHLWRQTHDAEGRQLFTTNEIRTVADAAVRYRSAADPAPYAGRILADGRFDESEIDGFLALAAKELPSLAEGDKLARLKALYMPLVHEGKCYFNGFAPGTYHGWNMEWHGLVSLAQFLGEKGVTNDSWKRVGWDLIDRYLSERAPEFNAASTDLSAFKARGGKIMMTLGWEDQTVPPGPILDYYEQVCERDGGIEKTREYFRLFCLPGCAHGGGRGRATTGSPSGAAVRKRLMDWREKGVAPKELVVKWRSANLELPVAPYPGLYVRDADGKWRVKEAKRGVSRVDPSVRATATDVGRAGSSPDADGCTAFIVGRKASATGRVIVGHNNDGFGPMKYAILPATDSAPALNEPGRTGGLGGGKSPVLYWQAVCSDKAKSGKATGDVLLNEYGVIMFSNSGGFMREWGGRKSELPDEAEAATVDGGIGLALRFEVVHRARSAAEGVRIATAFIDRYGYGPDARTFTIADRDEAWILCAVRGRRYVARRCPDDSVMAFPNILPVGRILPGDIVSKGIEAKRDTFDFAATYQGVRTKHDPSQRHRIAEFYRTTAGVEVDESELPWSVKPSHLVTVDDLKRGFSSHSVGHGRVSVHPEEVPGVDWPVCRLRTLESVICRFADSPADAAIFLAPGRPCETKYDEFRPFRDAPPPYFSTGAAAEALLSTRLLAPRLISAPERPAPRPALAARLAEGPEVHGIVHWGLNTYTDREWGFGDEDPAMLNPDKFDADQIVGACKAGGIGGLIIVAKHHDGFCLWPTKTTGHNITKTPFWKCKVESEKCKTSGDYVKEMEQACRRAGLKFGVYVSPWDRNNAAYGTEKYVADVFQKQIRELLSGDYGEIFEMWFDGANGGDGYYGGAREKRRIGAGYYRFGEVFGFVRELQPGVCIFAGESDDSDFRWPGNERGVLDADSRATICTVGGYADGKYGNPGYKDQINSGSPDGEFFRMCEADFPLRRGWFYHERERGTTKSAAYLTKLYLSSVGNGGTMNIGVAPDKSGRLDADDVRALAGFGVMRNALFAHEAKTGEPFNVVVMREDVSNGEQVDEWELVADGRAVLRGKSIGCKRIRLLETPCVARDVDLKIQKDGGALKGVSFKLYNADPELVKAVLDATGDDRETDTAKWMTKAAPESSGHRIAARDSWHGFDRRVFEFHGREAWIVEPKAEAEGRPWAWIMEWPGAFAKRTGSIALLKAGYHVVTLRPGRYENGKFVSQPGNMNDARLRESREFQKYLVDELRFAPKANLIGMSWGGFYSVRYAGTYPDAVSRIYLDAPLLDFSTLAGKEGDSWGLNAKYGVDVKTYVGKDDPRQPVNMYGPIAKAGIPVLLLYGGADATVPPRANCIRFANAFKAAGGYIEVVARGSYGHHPHGLEIDEQQKFVDFFNGK